MRSLISEGRLRHETVTNTADGFKPLVLEREGPTGLLVTTTSVMLEPELETRMFSIPVTDTPSHTGAVLAAIAAGAAGQSALTEIDPTPWHALQLWIEGGAREAVVPFASLLAAAIPPVAVRLRRDFMALLGLIQTHAILHQAHRERDDRGRVVATLDDYAAVYELTADLVAAGVGASVSPTVRETVAAVAELADAHLIAEHAPGLKDRAYTIVHTCAIDGARTGIALLREAILERLRSTPPTAMR